MFINVSGQTKHFYSISLHATITEKIMSLKPGEIIIGTSLAYIKKELTLFEAMEYLAGSPLSDAILRPEPHHFISDYNSQIVNPKSQVGFKRIVPLNVVTFCVSL